MNWNSWIRQIHRWLSIVFTLTVIANFVAMTQGQPPAWVTYSPLLPLALLLFTGLYLFVLPYATSGVADDGHHCQLESNPWRPNQRRVARRSRRPLEDWREETLARMRALILEADPEMIEERKWRKPSNAMAGVPVWSHNGIVCTGETYTKVVKLTFAQGASLPDPSRLFNSSLEGNTRRAIDIHEGEKVDAGAFKALVKAAVAQNGPPAKR